MTSQLGDEVTFAGTDRLLSSVTVTMSSWACQSGTWFGDNCQTTPGATFNWPITLNIYAPPASGSGTGPLLGSVTQTFALPYRPSKDDTNCTGGSLGHWFDGTTCWNGLANNITFDLSAAQLSVPNTVIWGVVYNTSDFGPSPQLAGACRATVQGCFYDSLNVVYSPTVKVGTKPYPDTAYQDSTTPTNYCDNGTAGVASYRLDSPSSACYTGQVPAAQFTATTLTPVLPEAPWAAALMLAGVAVLPGSLWIRRRRSGGTAA